MDTDGRRIKLIMNPANIQDRDSGTALLRASRPSIPFVDGVLSEFAYAGEYVTCITVQKVD
ncbi:MAG: hypothetical protein NVSMB18_08560 [Acetobacteraceae bacterium]